MFDIEETLRDSGINLILGVDEVGRGALISDVVVSCVILPAGHKIEGIKDSKKFTGPKAHENRIKISKLIHERALEVHIISAPAEVIDKINILEATKLCIITAISKCKIKPGMVIIDGDMEFEDGEIMYPYMCVEKADSRSENVAAASIVAKVHRDNHMLLLDKVYPQYGLAQHKGYGTKEHMEAILKYGPCELHRKSFSVKGRKIGSIKPSKQPHA